jgi:hypothetical protein
VNRNNIMILASFSLLAAGVHAYQSSVAMTEVGNPFAVRAHALPVIQERTAGRVDVRPTASHGVWDSAPWTGVRRDSSRVETDSLRVRASRG